MKKFSKKFIKNAFRLSFLPILLLCALMAGLTLKTGMLGGPFQDNSKDDGLGDQLITSGSWNLTGTPIFIDGDATGVDAHNWTWAVSQPWCSGDGSWGTPYLLENITIDGEGSGNCIEIRDSQNKYIKIKNCTVYNGDVGIKFLNVNNGTITNTTSTRNVDNGIYLDGCDNNSLTESNVSANGLPTTFITHGIFLKNSDNNTLENNTITKNTGYIMTNTLELEGSHNNTIRHNNISYNDANFCVYGIFLKDSHDNSIYNNSADFNDAPSGGFAIVLQSSNQNEIDLNRMDSNYEGIKISGTSTKNNVSRNTMKKCGIGIENNTRDNIIERTNHVNGKDVFYYENETYLTNDNFTDPGQIILLNCNHSSLIGFNISHTSRAISLLNGINDTISSCNVSYNNRGIDLWDTMNSTIANNIAFNNSYGIIVYGSYNNLSNNNASYNEIGIDSMKKSNTVSFNNCSFNELYGIYVEDINHTINNNLLFNNKEYGIYVGWISYNNTLVNNTIRNNLIAGVCLNQETEDNKIFKNNFTGNALHAQDNGTNNLWDNGAIGNYWDNYTGADSDDDGIGNIPYIFISGTAGSQDNKPIWDDGDDTNPKLRIILPNANDYFGTTAPNFNIEVSDEVELHSKWYTMDGGSVNITFSVNGTIDQGNWTLLSDGPVTLTFYVNDTNGNVNTSSVNVNKDSVLPTINIISPLPNSLFGMTSPNFTVEINDTNLDDMTYELPGGINRTFTYNTTFNAAEWSALPNGTNTIWFHANDSAGNVASSSMNVRIDMYVPELTIIFPSSNSYHDSAPEMRVIVLENNIDSIWYNVTGNATKVDITGSNDTLINLNSFIWSDLPEGMFQVSFFANDTAGNLNDTFVITLYKDTIAPNILINGPTNQSYWNAAPSINITIFEANFNETWATCNGQKITLMNNTDVSLGAIWVGLPQGSFQVFIHANDSAGNINDTLILTLYKDTIKPNITIILPTGGQLLSRTTLSFIIEVNETNIDTMWYSLDGGLNNYTFTVNGSFNVAAWQARWDALANQSIMTITFHVNDSVGHINSTSVQIIVNKISTTTPPTTTTTTTITPEDKFDILEFFTSPIGLITIGALVGAIALIIIVKSKGGKSSKKERGKIDEIVKNL